MSFGSAFSTPWEHIESGFARIAPGLDMRPQQRASLLRAVGDGHRSGNDRLLEQLGFAALATDDWSWPWFDECAASLEKARVWPFRWSRDGNPPGTRWRDVPGDQQKTLLISTLVIAALASRNLASYRRVRDLYFLTTRVNDERCAAEAYIRDLHRSAIEADDFGALPPYYPDCGVWLRVEIRKAR